MNANATNHPISWFKREADASTLDLAPDFQRRPVWDDEQASFLIDSVLNELPIPEVYIRILTAPDGTTVHEVVDGQQRIRSILRFCENDLALQSDELTPAFEGMTFEDLSDEQKTRFWAYKVVVRELGDISDDGIKGLFRRLNINSVVLNDQELRHAKFEGRFITTVEELADDPWWLEHGLFTVREIRRMIDVEFVSELLVGLMAGPQDKKSTIDEYFEDYDSEFDDEAFWRREFKRTKELIDDLFEIGIGRWRSKSEFYSLFLVLGDLLYEGKRFTPARLPAVAEALSAFREKVDQAKKRSNTKRFTADVHEYAEAVTRAATDLSRRASRDRILRELILEALSA